jgi:hypothetical protein
MATQWDNLKDKPEIKEGYDNEYMRMFVKQFASYFLEIHNDQPEKQNDILRKQEIDASIPEPQQ